MMALLLALALPGSAFADQRDRRGGRNYDNNDRRGHNRHNRDRRSRNRDNNSRKCGKFVNCHDARNGRWDGRGPQRDRNRRYDRRNRSNNRRDDARFQNRTDRRSGVREVNRTNTASIRRGRG